jgi:ABC-type multidrug transport system fused ATPase/permease subunit
MTDLDKYFGILDNETIVKDPKKEAKLTNVKGEIELKNIAFVYPKNKDRILDGINLEIKAGEKIAFVGRSGAGKTTLTILLLRFYDPAQGVV